METVHRDTEIHVSYPGLAAWVHQVTEPAVRSAIAALELPVKSRGFDAGCGIGTHTLWLAEAISPGGQVIGVDRSAECLTRAERAAGHSGCADRVSFRHGDLLALPFDAAAFDWAWSADTLWVGCEKVGAPGERVSPILKELVRVVRPGGTVALLFWSSQKLLPGYPLLEARLNATRAANYPYTDRTAPELHILRALGWLRRTGLQGLRVHTAVADVYAPLDDAARKALTGSFQMLWGRAEAEASPEDWVAFQRLCQPGSPGFILDLPDYYAFITYSLFYGQVPG
jgi:demethylmenaquinone methyltransferase/2-methoxy-6-polyprenyl-1,4-benzoquinol methylase